MRSLKQYFALVRHLGPGWLGYRVAYALRRRTGALRRGSPPMTWDGVPIAELQFAARPAVAPCEISEQAVKEADAVLRGVFRLFSQHEVDAGNLPDWHRNQLSGEVVPAERHWSELGDFAFGDIKGVWELSRFSWAFALARAARRTREKKYTDAFWQLFGDWCQRNPPNLGPNWMCGQEATFRLIAVVFATESLEVPTDRRGLLARFIVATGSRIVANLNYALSQKNNHGISECVGLITCALLAPGHPESTHWLATGLSKLQAQCAELIYDDGGFSQHSLIYHRVLLHDLVWVKARLEGAAQPVPSWLLEGGRRATEFLLHLADPLTGQGPLYGPNDGANVLPLADAEFLDLRPALQLASASFRGELPFPPGPWDEAAAWLFAEWEHLPRKMDKGVPADWHAPQAGCLQMTERNGRIFLRCPTGFRHRPTQADLLHVDVWQGGRPVAMEGGSFSYNSRERFVALGSAAQHNSLTFDGLEPMTKFTRFLYLPWPVGEAFADGHGGFQASHDGYAPLGVRWTRSVNRRKDGGWVVHDRVVGVNGRTLRWHWRLADRPWAVAGNSIAVSDELGRYEIGWRSNISPRMSLLRADPESAYGWWSPCYGKVEPACSLLIEARGVTGDVDLWTEFSAN